MIQSIDNIKEAIELCVESFITDNQPNFSRRFNRQTIKYCSLSNLPSVKAKEFIKVIENLGDSHLTYC
ncbi:MAG: hypothetical protein QNJ37_05810 [Crocosphaera sp.]|nr:hypothetical protein [Crocosphaera sp.]